MLILNFSHPLTEQHLETVRTLVDGPLFAVKSVTCQFDPDRPFAGQTQQLLDGIGLSPEEWQTTPLLLVLPSLAPIAAIVLAEIHGRAGYFPPVVRLKPVAGAIPPRFEVAELLELQRLRDEARRRR
jgi:hypothetical protein